LPTLPPIEVIPLSTPFLRGEASKGGKMHRIFRKALNKATGVTQSVIVVLLDIRGFSEFSMGCDSVDAAMFLKRVYVELIDSYFPFATFYKSTGDGLLLIVPIGGENITEVSQKVTASCIKCHSEFGSICKDDPMINFAIPDKVGIGMTRGNACCLVSGGMVIDYSGRWLNLAARLTDLARPSGVVIDGRFNIGLLTKEQRALFEEETVYLKGIYEAKPIKIFYTKEFTSIPEYNKRQIATERWRHMVDVKPYRDLLKFDKFRYQLESEPINPGEIKVLVKHNKVMGGKVVNKYSAVHYFADFSYKEEAGKPVVLLDFPKLCAKLQEEQVKKNMNVEIDIAYVEK
jgi:class 3 adenylate cyclase